MIRINLLAVERERTKKKSTFLTGQKVTIACSLVLVLAIVAIGWRYLSLNSESKQLDIDIANSQEEATRLHAMTENVLLEIQKTFDFFKATAASDHIDRVLLSGGASRVDGFVKALEDRFGTSVELLDPFKTVMFEADKLGVIDAEGVMPTAAVAVGLALRRAGDR